MLHDNSSSILLMSKCVYVHDGSVQCSQLGGEAGCMGRIITFKVGVRLIRSFGYKLKSNLCWFGLKQWRNQAKINCLLHCSA